MTVFAARGRRAEQMRHCAGQMDAALNFLFVASGKTKSTRTLSPGFSFDRS
jgi:hypothetical protein